MRKLKYLFFIVLLLLSFKVDALKRNSSDLINRKVCDKFEVIKANTNGTITSVACFTNYNDAKKKMNEDDDKTLAILERSSNVTRVIDAKYALAYLDKGKDALTYIYTSNSVKTEITYMNNYRDYGATDAAYLELSYANKAIKVRIGGVTGWIKNGEYTIIPISWVKNASYYSIDDKSIKHFYARDIEEVYSQYSRTLGPKPPFEIANGNYKSFDGIYFYQDYYQMIDDYRLGKHDLAVNKDNAYYNYYLYLPHRTKTNYSIDDIDSYIRNVLNFKGNVYAKTKPSNYSVLYGSAEYFLYAEKIYGANALSAFSLSRNESANGTSSIAIDKNNIFGHDAVDGAAYTKATGYLDIRSSIYSHGYGYINYGYAEVADSRYYGSHFGNKNTGMNVKYASDVYWGEKAASYYYSFDKDNGMLDYNYYQLILSNTSNINARTAPNTKSTIVYSIKKSGFPFVLLEEVEGETIKNSNIWYKIQADSNITNTGAIIGSNKDTWPHYNWNGFVYVHSSFFDKINVGKKENDKYYTPSLMEKDVNNYEIITNANNTTYTPEVLQINSDINYYYSATLLEKKGTIKKGSYAVALEKVIDEDNTKYLIITDYSTYQKGWIDSNDTKVIKKDLLSITKTDAGSYISIIDKNNKQLFKVYAGNFLPIVDKELVGDKLYLKVQYQNVGSILYGYVDSTRDDIKYTIDYINFKPVINASSQIVLINNLFDAMEGVSGTDMEDGDITSKIKVTKNNVNTNKVGTYEVIYELTDSYGETVTKTINIQVVEPIQSDALFMYNELKHIENNKFLFSGFMGVKGMDNTSVKTNLIFVNEVTKEEYSFKLDKWNDYPYEMASLDDAKHFNYSGGWFRSSIDLSSNNLPNGDYTLYVETVNQNKKAKTLFTNIAYMDMARRVKGNKREFLIEVDYSTLNSPLLFSVRDTLISLDVPKSFDPMYNFFNEIKLDNTKLMLKGTSHSVGISFGEKDTVERKLVLENKKTFERFEMELGSITNGDYPITLAVSDNCDKTKAWYMNTIDLASIPKGEYILYIKNTVNNLTYYGEITDVSYTDFSMINNNKFIFSRNDNIRLRLELIVKE